MARINAGMLSPVVVILPPGLRPGGVVHFWE